MFALFQENTHLILCAAKGNLFCSLNSIKMLRKVTLNNSKYYSEKEKARWSPLLPEMINSSKNCPFAGLKNAVEKLLQKGALIDDVNEDKFTALMTAADWGKTTTNTLKSNRRISVLRLSSDRNSLNHTRSNLKIAYKHFKQLKRFECNDALFLISRTQGNLCTTHC